MEEDYLVQKILLTHDPDGRHLNSELLLRAMEDVMHYATQSEVSDRHSDAISLGDNEVIGPEGTLGNTVYKISRKILCNCYKDEDSETKLGALFDTLGHYTWDAKVVLLLAAFALCYGEFWLIMQVYAHDHLAASIAVLKQLPRDLSVFKPRFKALSLLINAMVEVTNRHPNTTIIATWGLSSLAFRLSSLCSDLKSQVDMCHQQIETRLLKEICDVFKETHADNQKVLQKIFALKDDLPLKDCSSQAELQVSELKNKVVILLVSKPELLPVEQIHFLVQQTYNDPYNKEIEGSYQIIWIPVPSSDTWTLAEKRSFHFLSNSLPWISIRHTRLLSSAVVNFIKREWNFNEEPLMVVLDLQGHVTNSNAIDMVLIWGAKAFPFSTVRERELWEQENWTLQLMVHGISPLLMNWVEDGKNICIYGSDNLDWIREFNSGMKEIKSAGVPLEVIYAGRRNSSEHVRNILAIIQRNILAIIDEDDLYGSLTLIQNKLFWLRLESMRKSLLNLGYTLASDGIMKEVSDLLDIDSKDQNWVVIGKGSSTDIVKLQEEKLKAFFDHFAEWGKYVGKLGLVGAISTALEPPYNEELGDRLVFSSSDDNVMMKQVQATHTPDGREFDLKPIVCIIEQIIHRTTSAVPGAVLPDASDEEPPQSDFSALLEVLAHTISRISCEISCKCSGGGDAHATAMTILNALSSYSWDAKVVIALAGFSVNYAEFWLVAQLYPSQPLAKLISQLKQLPYLLESGIALKPRIEALNNLIKAILDLTKCIVGFKELPSQYISSDAPELQTAMVHFHTAVYWTIRGIVACASIIMAFVGMGQGFNSTSETWELASLANKISNIHSHLMAQLAMCHQHVDEKRNAEAYQMLLRLFDTVHIDNMRTLKALIYTKDDLQPLYEGSTKKRVDIDVLRRKMVLLYISDLDVSFDELMIFTMLYQEMHTKPSRLESQHEVVWLPVIDRSTYWTDVNQQKFEQIQSVMPWYSVWHPSLVDPAVIKYIKEVWHFSKKSIVVVLDPQGKVVNTNALHMMWIWGSMAFPFTSLREEALWKEETWRMEFLTDSIEQMLVDWIVDGRTVCLYGGEDLDWIRKFTSSAKAVARAAGIKLEMLYVGKSNQGQRVLKNATIIEVEKLSHALSNRDQIWFFWSRLESMWHSKVQQGKSVENDAIMQEIMRMLSFDASDQGWAVISSGSEMVKAKGDTILRSFNEHDIWMNNARERGFTVALNDHIRELQTPHHCNRLILPGIDNPEKVVCAECGRLMEKLIIYSNKRETICIPPSQSVLVFFRIPSTNTPPFPSMATANSPSKMQLVKSDRPLFAPSDDNVMMKQVQATHAPDGLEFDLKPVVCIIEQIILRATSTTPGAVSLDVDEKPPQSDFSAMLEVLAHTISTISCESTKAPLFNLMIEPLLKHETGQISYKCSGGGDAHATAITILNSLSAYSWDAKLVIALAGFSMNYAEFWLVAQLYPSQPLAKLISQLKQLPYLLESGSPLKPRFEALSNVIKAVLDLTKCIVEFMELPSQYISSDAPELQTAMVHFPTAVYWSIRGIVACASIIRTFVGMGHELQLERSQMLINPTVRLNITSTTETWEPSSLDHKVSKIHEHLMKQLALCHQHVDKKRNVEAYQTLLRLFDTVHINNMKILKALICTKDDLQPLYEGYTKKRVNIGVLRRKMVLLYISDLDISLDELMFIEELYQDMHPDPSRLKSQHEVVWLPVIDRPTPRTDGFERIRSAMPWYSVWHPSLVGQAVIKYIKEVWHFSTKPIVVVLDPQGKVVNTNALHMMWIWKSTAFPFTSLREEALWKEETWRMEFLAGSVEPMLFNWIRDGTTVCLYGGDDLDWIRKFTTGAKAVVQAANIKLEMLYVGKSNPRERVLKNSMAIEAEKLSHALSDRKLIWFFWARLESMHHSKVHQGKSVENDVIMQEIMRMLSFDASDRGWAVISRGSEMVKAKGDTMLRSFNEHINWVNNARRKGFIVALNDHICELQRLHHCNRWNPPEIGGKNPEEVVCAECGRLAEKLASVGLYSVATKLIIYSNKTETICIPLSQSVLVFFCILSTNTLPFPSMATANSPSKMQVGKGDRLVFSSSDDNVMMKQVQATHAPDGRHFDLKPVICIIEQIILRATSAMPGAVSLDALDEKPTQSDFSAMFEDLAYTISRISCEISYQCSGGGDAHATAITILNALSAYSWDAKLVIALAGFSMNYAEFWLVAQLYPSQPLAKLISQLKQLPYLLESGSPLKPRFEALSNVIKAVLDLTKCIVEFMELPSQYISSDAPELQTAMVQLPTAVYWSIRGIVACASIIMTFVGMYHESQMLINTTVRLNSTSETWELVTLTHKVSNIHGHLMEQLAICHQHIDEKRNADAYQMLLRLFNLFHIDNMRILKALIYTKDDLQPLYKGSTKRRVNIDVLRRKMVLLYISDLDISLDELVIFTMLYEDMHTHLLRSESQHGVVWLPVIDSSTRWTDVNQQKFEYIRSVMPCYSVWHPSLVDPAVIKYIKEVWHFGKKPIVVVLDPQGKVVNTNALHMMWIWGSMAFPFTSLREEALWKEETWSVGFLANFVEQMLVDWIRDGTTICLYGGEDLDWIRKFTTSAKATVRAANIKLEMLYVGKSNPRERVLKNSMAIEAEKLSHALSDRKLIWFFWARLESMWHSKVQQGKSVENDVIMQEIMRMLSFDASDQGWAVISRGPEMVKAKGDTILRSFNEHDIWMNNAREKGFIVALNDHIRGLQTPHHCNRLILPGIGSDNPEKVVCAECGRLMEKLTLYRCCTD
ncbi:hypothetical protein RJ640_030716 [Escallonia rubra]|uniref:Protein SIEVE ELEMENT OCCLUSION B n=1 Tax=Escallonia rubra TaxID=112253 RepID=A0AA88QVS4_9ASTE|nr:hypothetical protein RJ640_030716 [Escallonia rubra]